jgi:curved DNA-binding protein
MHTKDYYAALEITPEADEHAIKRAFRTLARQCHPDVRTDAQAAERFQLINEAYQILSDPQRRQRYDQVRRQWQQGHASQARWHAWATSTAATYAAEDVRTILGSIGTNGIFADIFGGAVPDNSQQASPARGRDHEATVQITLEEALHGTQRTLHVGARRVEVAIPPGTRAGARLRLAGQGEPGPASGQAGDVLVHVELLPHQRFERSADDLHLVLPIDIYTAAVGGTVRVPTLDGSVLLKIPPQTQADQRVRLRGQGMSRLDDSGQRGDLYVQVKLVLPEALSPTELATLRTLADQRCNVDAHVDITE